VNEPFLSKSTAITVACETEPASVKASATNAFFILLPDKGFVRKFYRLRLFVCRRKEELKPKMQAVCGFFDANVD
jgi:hypothetical protein